MRFDWRAHLDGVRAMQSMIPEDGVWDDVADARVGAFERAHWKCVSPARNRLREAVAAERLARVAMAIYAHRAATGDWPEAAAELAERFPNGAPADPFTDAPFVMERSGDALVLRAAPPQGAIRDSLRDLGLEWRLAPR